MAHRYVYAQCLKASVEVDIRGELVANHVIDTECVAMHVGAVVVDILFHRCLLTIGGNLQIISHYSSACIW